MKFGIVVLLGTAKNDILNLRRMIGSLEAHVAPRLDHELIIFHEGAVPAVQYRGPVRYVPVAFNQTKLANISPPGFRKRSKWGYTHMCNFFFSNVFRYLTEYELVMRLDTDSCFVGRPPDFVAAMADRSYSSIQRDKDCEHFFKGGDAGVGRSVRRAREHHAAGTHRGPRTKLHFHLVNQL